MQPAPGERPSLLPLVPAFNYVNQLIDSFLLGAAAVGTRHAAARSPTLPKEIAITLWSLAAACIVAFSVAALASPH